MIFNETHILHLTEYHPLELLEDAFSIALAQTIESHYTQQIEVEPPSYKTRQKWRLTAQGWVGTIPLAPHFHLYLQPKTPLRNLFAMMEYTEHWQQWSEIGKGVVKVESLPAFFEQLAGVLARGVLERSRKGLSCAYLLQQDRLRYVRGRVDLRTAIRQPVMTDLPCDYEEQTTDIADNQILAWTLSQILRANLCGEATLPLVRNALHVIQSAASLQAFHASDCVGRNYHRLNQAYQPLHALCRFFLAHLGPSHQPGDWAMLPFLINMAQLFEQFVAEWLRRHLPVGWHLQAQESIVLDEAGQITFRPDLVLYKNLSEASAKSAHMILDTKYKVSDTPLASDIAQAIAYAQTKGCAEAVLIYPAPIKRPIEIRRNGIRVRSLSFRLDEELEGAGERLLGALFDQTTTDRDHNG